MQDCYVPPFSLLRPRYVCYIYSRCGGGGLSLLPAPGVSTKYLKIVPGYYSVTHIITYTRLKRPICTLSTYSVVVGVFFPQCKAITINFVSQPRKRSSIFWCELIYKQMYPATDIGLYSPSI